MAAKIAAPGTIPVPANVLATWVAELHGIRKAMSVQAGRGHADPATLADLEDRIHSLRDRVKLQLEFVVPS